MSAVTVISCTSEAWMHSSETMGLALAETVGADKVKPVPCSDVRKFIQAFRESDEYMIIHTHGSPSALSDEKNGGKRRFVSLSRLFLMRTNRRIKFVFITACETAGGNRSRNIASVISRKIARDGYVIANIHTVVGADRDFRAADEKHGWVLYQNGKPADMTLPASLSVKEAYNIAKKGLK